MTKEVTYYARVSYADDGITAWFPDVLGYGDVADTLEDAIKNAEDGLTYRLNIGDEPCGDVFYPPSTLEELLAEAETSEYDDFREIEDRYEFIPITITPRNDSYLKNLAKERRLPSQKVAV